MSAMSQKIATSLKSTLSLNDGARIPLFGLGTSRSKDTRQAVKLALQAGYRLIDTAIRYGNEKEVGEGLRESGIPRDEVYIVSKVWNDKHGYDACKKEVEQSISRLGVEYIDLYLIHSPIGAKIIETYDCLLDLKAKGLIRSVGVSNFAPNHLEGMKASGRPLPAVNQIELHPFYHKDDIVDWCRKHQVAVMGYCPLAKCSKLDDLDLCRIAEKHKQTPVKVMIRWSVQHGFITIPMASTAEHIQENANVFDWSIDEEDQEAMNAFPVLRVSWDPTTEPWID